MNHTVIVKQRDVDSYLAKGYALSIQSPKSFLTGAWDLLDEEDRADLVALEIPKEEHEKLHAPPQLHRARRRSESFVMDVTVDVVDLLNRDGWKSIVAPAVTPDNPVQANSQESGGATECANDDLHETRREAVEAQKNLVLYEIGRHMEAVGKLTDFLRRNNL